VNRTLILEPFSVTFGTDNEALSSEARDLDNATWNESKSADEDRVRPPGRAPFGKGD